MAKELMGWDSTKKRWHKRYRGKLYFRSARQLDCEPTKEASRVAANEWWERKQAEIDAQLGKAKKHPPKVVQHYECAVRNHELYAKWHRKYGRIEDAQKSEAMIEWLDEALKQDSPPFPLSKSQEDPRWEIAQGLPLDDQSDFYVLWEDRFRTILKDERDAKIVPTENTIKAHIDDYLRLRKAQHQARGKISAYHNLKQWLNCFLEWVPPHAALEDLTEGLWERFFVFLSGKVSDGTFSSTTAKNYQSAARWFIKSRWEKRLIDLPRNLSSRQLSFRSVQKDPVTFTVDEVQQYLEAATEHQQLFLLLMLNCGMYPSDIGQLRQNEVDWMKGRICRKRTKTRDRSENVPRVDYPLWRRTFELLKKFRSDDETLALVNANGQPLWREEEKEDGIFWRDDNIKSSYWQLQTRQLKLKKGDKRRKPLKSFRKTGATLLEQSKYGRFAEHFLGEAPTTIANAHYAHQNGKEFDEAVLWLGEQLKIE